MSEEHKQPLILAVDDDENSLLVLEGFLFPQGYEVAFAHSGADALEAVKAREPDVVLLDAMMPGMDGFEVARRLKGRPETRHIPIVMVTALRHVEDRVRALDAGADDILSKPVEQTEICARVRTLVKMKAYNDHMRDYQETLKREVEAGVAEARLAYEKAAAAEHALDAQRALNMRADRLRSLGEMAAGIAHELNQPLVGVRGMAEHLLLASKRGWDVEHERRQEKLSEIIRQADRMTHIIRHVRSFANPKERLTVMPTNLNKVVHAALDLVRAQLRSRGVEVQCRLCASLPAVMANPFDLEEVVVNLLLNARDAIAERVEAPQQGDAPQRITLRTLRNGNETERRVVFEITDTGAGIPEDVMNKVCDPFFTTKDPGHGTGLGLSISRSIIARYSGTLTLRSKMMYGTTATIELPGEEDKA